MALPDLDFTTITTQADCAATNAKNAVKDGVKNLKGKLNAFTSDPDGVFTAGAGIAASIQADVNRLSVTAQRGLGELQKNVISLRDELAAAILVWQKEGSEAAEKAFTNIKQKFPSFNQDQFVANLQKPGFNLCADIKNQTIADGAATPKPVPPQVPPPAADAATVIPDPPTIPAISVRPPVGPQLSVRDTNELAKVRANANLFVP